MRTNAFLKSTFIAALLILASAFSYGEALAHCDSMDGPVIIAAKEALKTGEIKPVLAWVQPGDEPLLKSAFQKTLAIRKMNPEAQEFADTYFFETLVRVHRAGEGAPYTGLKPAGQVEHAVAIADKAIGTGSADQLVKDLNGAVSMGVHERFKNLIEKKKHANESVHAGREYVAAYVEFVHYVERLHESAVAGGHEHGAGAAPDSKAGAAKDHKAVHEHK